MRITFSIPRGEHSKPRNLVAEGEVLFSEEPFNGMKLVGFCVWEGDRGVYVTFPSRAYEAPGGGRKYFDYLRTQDKPQSSAGQSHMHRVKRWIQDEYRAWARGGERGHGPVDDRNGDDPETHPRAQQRPASPKPEQPLGGGGIDTDW